MAGVCDRRRRTFGARRGLARIEAAVASWEAGGVLLIQGAGGIGRSTLLRTLCEHAARQGLRTLKTRLSELERDLGSLAALATRRG
ncbi:MAG TPA: hypothetical protein VF788_09470 [Pseudonocardiaceae bacterium]